jgi:beta-galactosidase
MKKSLNFGWDFLPGFLESSLKSTDPKAKKVDLPHSAVEVPVNYFDETSYQGLFTYSKLFDSELQENQVCSLLLEGVMLKAHVYLNGHDLGEQLSGWMSVSFDLTPYLIRKDNRLVIVVDSREDPHVPPFGKAVDYLTFAGIYRPVYLVYEPKTHLSFVHAEGHADGTLKVESQVVNGTDYTLSYRLFYGGKLVKEFTQKEIQLPSVELWSIDRPNLYTLEVTLTTPFGEEKQSLRLGFRDAKFTPEGFFLNGEKIKLVGLNRHQNYPYVGPAMPASAQRDDADILKTKLGCNLVRTSHYTDSEAFLNRCDELGLLVVDEVPGWQYIGQDEAWRKNFQYFIEKMVEKERNHPSLIAYGTRIDESQDDDELYSKALAYIRQVNPSRQCLGVRNFKTSHCLEDIYAYNDFSCSDTQHGLDDPKSVKGANGKPLLISEHNGHMFPTKQSDASPRRLEHALRHLRVLDDAFKYDRIAGAIGWCAFDYNTHRDFGAGDHICYHGVSDIYRNPKAAAFAYASQNSPLPVMWIANPPTSGDNDEALMRPLYVFTNCDYVEFYRNGRFVDVFQPDKKDFPHLPHAPIVIDDFIGALFNEEGFSRQDSLKLKEALNLVGQNGIAHVKKSQLVKYLPVILKNHLSTDKLLAYYYKYMSGWGEKAIVYQFKGYKEGKFVCEKSYGPSTQFSYRFELSNRELQNNDTYDVLRVSIKYVDEWGSQMHYANPVVSFKCLGPIEVIGPTTVALQGGDVSVYIRSQYVERRMEARLIVSTPQGDYPLDFMVQ